jgi:hypothetical protein
MYGKFLNKGFLSDEDLDDGIMYDPSKMITTYPAA